MSARQVSDKDGGRRRFLGIKRPSNADIVLYMAYALSALLIAGLFWKCTIEYDRATMKLLTDYHAHKPFQYRILTIWMVHAMQWLVPIKYTHAYFLISVGFTFLTFVAYRHFVSLFMPVGKAIVYSFFGMAWVLIWNYCLLNDFYYPYDIPAVFFFTVGLILIYRERWYIYYPLFALATLNRETACFLIVAYFFVDISRRRFLWISIHLVAQMAVWLAIKYVVTATFVENPGASVFEFQLHNNIGFLLSILQLQLWPMHVLLTFGFVYVMIPFYWKEHPIFLKRLLFVLIPFFVGMSIVGVLWETRLYSELIPILLTPAILSVDKIIIRSSYSGIESTGG